MVQLKLTEEHKTKLLEMCVKLFPKYKIIIEQDYARDYNAVAGILSIRDNDTDNFITKYHWFEFCLLHLAKQIIYPLYVPANCNSEEGLQIGIEEFGNDVLYYPKTHPVDYLYSKFKELK